VLREVFTWFWPRMAGLLLVGAVLAVPVALLTHVQRALPAIATAVAVIAGLMSPIVWGALQGIEKFNWFGLSQISFAGAKFVAGVALASAGYGAAAILFGVAAASVLAAGVSLWPLRRMLKASRKLKVPKLKFATAYLPEASVALSLFTALAGMDLVVSRIAFPGTTAGAYAAEIGEMVGAEHPVKPRRGQIVVLLVGRGGRSPLQAPQQKQLKQRPEQEGGDDGDGHGRPEGQARLIHQAPQDIGADSGQRALREVDHPAHLIDQGEPQREQSVDAPCCEATYDLDRQIKHLPRPILPIIVL